MKQGATIHRGFDEFANSVHGFVRRSLFSVSRLREQALCALAAAESAEQLDEDALIDKIVACRTVLRKKHSSGDCILTLGLIANIVYRTLGIRPYPEQLMGVLCMGDRFAIQMQTGEGKTITAAMAAIMACWKGRACHVVTSNDYLAKRDAENMSALFIRCGLTSGYVIGAMKPPERRAAYLCDITYSTSKELLADYLRDAMACEQSKGAADTLLCEIGGNIQPTVMRGLDTAIVDEADSVLIDEAIVPLIISVPNSNRMLHEAVQVAYGLIASFTEGTDYQVYASRFQVVLTPEGREKLAEEVQQLPAVWNSRERSEFLVCQALIARHCYHRDSHYIVQDGKIIIVDERTGRIMEGRSWSGGLHQAIEAKEHLELTDPTYSHTQMSFQLFFRQYRHLSGMSGTLQNVSNELWTIYGLLTVRIPTHLPKQMTALQEYVFATCEEKWDAVLEEVLNCRNQERPVLVGTRTIRDSEELHGRMAESGIESAVLNAVLHEQEAAIISRAGDRRQVTIATNMAGRGTDILVPYELQQVGGLHVIATERHESRRVDMQLFGRTARQGAPGSVRMMTSLEDELMRKYVPAWLMRIFRVLVRYPSGKRMIILLNSINQRRIEAFQARIRKKILLQDISQNKILSFANR
jgi:preprotein translocase subunit SecA